MYGNILNTISEKVGKIDISDFKGIVSSAERRLLESHKNSLAIVAEAYGKAAVLSELKTLCAYDGDISQLTNDNKPFCVTFTLGEDDTLPFVAEDNLGYQKTAYRKIVVSAKCDALKKADISFYCGFDFHTLDAKVLGKHDYLAMFTNAIMAMNINEKKWIKETVEPCFGCDRFVTVIFNTQLLNTDEEVDSVADAVKGHLNRVNADAKLFKATDEFRENIMNVFDEAELLNQKRCKYIVKNCITDITGIAKKHMEAKNIDIDKLKELTQKVEKEKKSIEISGRVAVSSKIENLYSDIKFQVVPALEKYIDEAYESIINRISETTDLEKDIELIPSYLEKALTLFEDKLSEKLAKDHTGVIKVIEEDLEKDCNYLLKIVDVPGANSFIEETYASVRLDMTDKKEKTYCGTDGETLKKSKLVSNGMLVASVVSALFVSPFTGIALLVGKTIYDKFSQKEISKETRTTVLEQLANDREEMKKQLRVQVEENLEKMKRETKEKVSEAYKKVVDSIAESIIISVEKVEKAKDEYQALEKLVNESLPELIAVLN